MEFPWKVTPEVPLYICELHLMNHEPFLINTLNVLQSSYHQIRSISSHCDKPFTMNVFVFTMVFTWLIQVNSDSWVDSHSLIELFEYAGVMGCTKLFPIGSEFGNHLVIAFSSQVMLCCSFVAVIVVRPSHYFHLWLRIQESMWTFKISAAPLRQHAPIRIFVVMRRRCPCGTSVCGVA